LKNFKRLTKAKKVEFISEKLMAKKFEGVKVGAIPPFGNLWKLKTFVDKSLLKEREIILNGGDYNFSIKIKSKDFKKLVPDLILGNFGKKK
jgi:Ala-tRNA(Pro) deacylase